MKKKHQFLVGVLAVGGAVGYLMFTAIRETSLYYLTIEEFHARQATLGGEGIRVAGRVQAGSMQWDPKDLRLSFLLGPFTDGAPGGTVPVRYQGVLPDMFAEGRDVIVEGRYHATRAGIEARIIMTSCPSKYEPAVSPGPRETAERRP
jgi:cytochrome c-type biogenesis protein CcmE